MKRVGNLWPQICDYENLYQAYIATVKGRRYKPPLLKYTDNLDFNLSKLHDELVSLKWQPKIAFTKVVYFPKKRVITAPIPYDRVAFHAIIDVIRPYFEKRFITDSFACIAGRGTFQAVCRVQRMIHGVQTSCGKGYVLKADIHAYFANIDHSICKQLIRKVIKDPSVLLILDRIIDSSPGDVGLPLGALSSQLMANVYLNELDHFVKEKLCVRNYARFMDDFVIVEESKEKLKEYLDKIRVFLIDVLKLELNPKTDIFQIKQGVDFCGYRIFPTYLLPRKRNVKNARRRLKKLHKDVLDGVISLEKYKRSLNSYLGYSKHCKSRKTVDSLLEELTF